MLARIDPAAAAKMRADVAKAEQDQTEDLKQAHASDREERVKALAEFKAVGDRHRAAIAAMTPQERALPAFYIGFEGVELVPAGTPNARAVVRRNPAFYKVRGSPFEPRAILVQLPNAYKQFWPQQERLFKQLDWAAIKKMVKP